MDDRGLIAEQREQLAKVPAKNISAFLLDGGLEEYNLIEHEIIIEPYTRPLNKKLCKFFAHGYGSRL